MPDLSGAHEENILNKKQEERRINIQTSAHISSNSFFLYNDNCVRRHVGVQSEVSEFEQCVLVRVWSWAFCVSHRMAITHNFFKQKVDHMGQMTDFVVTLSDIQLYLPR